MRKQIAAIRAARKGNVKGFTLIELLIVVLILGILAAIVMFAVGSFTTTSAVAACNTDAKTTETAVTAFYATNGTWPTSMTQLTSSDQKVDPGGPYLRSVPNSPYYAISLDTTTAGDIDIATPAATGTPADYEAALAATPSVNLCDGA